MGASAPSTWIASGSGSTSTTARPATAASSGSAQVFDFPVAASTGRAAYVAGTFDTKGRELYFLRQCLEKLGLRVVTVDLATSGKPSTAAIHPREVARHHPDGEAAVFSERPRQRRHRDGARLRALRRDAKRPRRPDRRRRLGRHHAGDQRHARAAGRRSEGDGLDDGQRRHAALRRPERHLHDVLGHRRAGHPSHQRAGARQRGARAGRNDRPPAGDLGDQQAGARPDHVRRHDGVRAGRRQAPRGRLRLPRLPRHRRRRPVDGKARRLGPARRRDRRLDDRDRRRDRRRRALRRADPARRLRAPSAALRRLVRRARHGELRRLGHGARALQGAGSSIATTRP